MGTDVTTVQEELVVQLLVRLLRDDQGEVNGEEKVHFQSIQLLDGNTADARVELVTSANGRYDTSTTRCTLYAFSMKWSDSRRSM